MTPALFTLGRCGLELGESDTCDLSALLFAAGHPEVSQR